MAAAGDVSFSEEQADRGRLEPISRFGEGALTDEEIRISRNAIDVPGYGQPVSLLDGNPYDDMV